MGRIQRVSALSSELIAAGANLGTFASIAEELIFNALDAEATTVSVVVTLSDWAVLVEDNGTGIDELDMPIVACRHATSKLLSMQSSYGHRGTALANIATIGVLSVRSRASDSASCFGKIVDGSNVTWSGTVSDDQHCPPRRGCIVQARDCFRSIPVRRRQSNPKTETAHLLAMVTHVALVHPGVVFRVVDGDAGRELLALHRSTSTLGRLASLYGSARILNLSLTHVQHKSPCGRFKVSGYIGTGHPSRELQLVYLNGRYARKVPALGAIIDAAAVGAGCAGTGRGAATAPSGGARGAENDGRRGEAAARDARPSHLAYLLDVRAASGTMDVVREPDRSLVEFTDWGAVRETLRTAVRAALGLPIDCGTERDGSGWPATAWARADHDIVGTVYPATLAALTAADADAAPAVRRVAHEDVGVVPGVSSSLHSSSFPISDRFAAPSEVSVQVESKGADVLAQPMWETALFPPDSSSLHASGASAHGSDLCAECTEWHAHAQPSNSRPMWVGAPVPLDDGLDELLFLPSPAPARARDTGMLSNRHQEGDEDGGMALIFTEPGACIPGSIYDPSKALPGNGAKLPMLHASKSAVRPTVPLYGALALRIAKGGAMHPPIRPIHYDDAGPKGIALESSSAEEQHSNYFGGAKARKVGMNSPSSSGHPTAYASDDGVQQLHAAVMGTAAAGHAFAFADTFVPRIGAAAAVPGFAGDQMNRRHYGSVSQWDSVNYVQKVRAVQAVQAAAAGHGRVVDVHAAPPLHLPVQLASTLGRPVTLAQLHFAALHPDSLVGQLDNKFLLLSLPLFCTSSHKTPLHLSRLVCVDQHAADERARLEAMESALFGDGLVNIITQPEDGIGGLSHAPRAVRMSPDGLRVELLRLTVDSIAQAQTVHHMTHADLDAARDGEGAKEHICKLFLAAEVRRCAMTNGAVGAWGTTILDPPVRADFSPGERHVLRTFASELAVWGFAVTVTDAPVHASLPSTNLSGSGSVGGGRSSVGTSVVRAGHLPFGRASASASASPYTSSSGAQRCSRGASVTPWHAGPTGMACLGEVLVHALPKLWDVCFTVEDLRDFVTRLTAIPHAATGAPSRKGMEEEEGRAAGEQAEEAFRAARARSRLFAAGCRPPAVVRVMNSKACRGAVMFGDALTREEALDLLRRLSTCKLPFQCAHGRPAMIPLLTTAGAPQQLNR